MFRTYLLSVCFLTSVIVQRSWSKNALSGNVQRAKHGQFPFVISISYDDPDKSTIPGENHICGGALITHKHVLTSAHCFDQFESHLYVVVVKTNIDDWFESVSHKIKKWTTYYDWIKRDVINKDFYDVAIVELEERVGWHIKPADILCIPESRLYYKKVKIVGWSITKDNYPQHLSSAKVVVVPSKHCLRNLWKDMKDQINITGAPLFMCTMSEPPVLSDCGDSGNPVLRYSNKIIAVHKGTCNFKLVNGTMAYRENTHVPVQHIVKFLNEVASYKCKEHECCVQ